jgi:S-formylglutathione hydrolase
LTVAGLVDAQPFERLELLSEHACFGGVQRFYRHASNETGLPMRFGLFLPPQALAGVCPCSPFWRV